MHKICPNCLGEGTVQLTEYFLVTVCWVCEGFGKVEVEDET